MTLTLALSVAAPLGTALAALLWAGFVAPGVHKTSEAETSPDLRTW
jgi:hypothetical protein